MLLWAALYGRLDAIKTALKHNADTDTTAVIHEPMWNQFLQFLPGWLGLELIRRNQLTTTPLGMAVAAGHRDLILFLIQHGATIDRYIGFGLSPLMAAVQVDRTDLVELPLQNSADPGFRYYRNMNALELTAKKEPKDVVVYYLDMEQIPTANLPIPRSPGRKTRSVRAYYCSAVLSDHAIPRRTLNHYDGEGWSNYSGSADLKSRNEIGT